jgi:hypothetical protein
VLWVASVWITNKVLLHFPLLVLWEASGWITNKIRFITNLALVGVVGGKCVDHQQGTVHFPLLVLWASLSGSSPTRFVLSPTFRL